MEDVMMTAVAMLGISRRLAIAADRATYPLGRPCDPIAVAAARLAARRARAAAALLDRGLLGRSTALPR